MVQLFYTTYISVDLAHQVIFHAKDGKGGIKDFMEQPSLQIGLRYFFDIQCAIRFH